MGEGETPKRLLKEICEGLHATIGNFLIVTFSSHHANTKAEDIGKCKTIDHHIFIKITGNLPKFLCILLKRLEAAWFVVQIYDCWLFEDWFLIRAFILPPSPSRQDCPFLQEHQYVQYTRSLLLCFVCLLCKVGMGMMIEKGKQRYPLACFNNATNEAKHQKWHYAANLLLIIAS